MRKEAVQEVFQRSIIRTHVAKLQQRLGRSMARALPLMATACLVPVLVSGCATERVTTSDGRPMAERPRPAPPTPDSAEVNKMAFMVGSRPDDTSGNGYPDLIHATVVLFAEPHPTSVRGNGAFEFYLYPFGTAADPDVKPVASWRVEGDAVGRTRANGLYGPAHQFELSLLDAGGDVYQLRSVDLRCVYIPDDGGPRVHSDGARPIRIGR